MSNFWDLVRRIKPYSTKALLNILFNILSIIFNLFSMIMVVPFLQLLFDRTPLVTVKPEFVYTTEYIKEAFYFFMSQYIVQQGKEAALVYVCLVVALVFLLKNLFRYLALYFMAPIRNGIVRDIRSEVYTKYLKLPLSYHSSNRKGDLITRITSDISEIERGIISMLEITFREPLTIIVFLGYMLNTSAALTGFVFLMIILMGSVVGRIGKSLKKQSHEGQEILGFITSMLDETLGGLKVIFGFNAQENQVKRFEQANQTYYNVFNKMFRKRDLSSPLTEFLAIIIVCVVLWFGGKLVLETMQSGSVDGLQPESFIAFMVVFSQLIPPAKNFSSAYYDIQKGLASYERVQQVLATQAIIKDATDAVSIDSFRNEIEIKNVSFSYPSNPERKILDNISLKIPKGKFIALVGGSGSGKSTLTDLLLRLYDVQQGEILIDGSDIKKIKMHDVRNLFGLVTQEPVLFNDTIEQNIFFGSGTFSSEKIQDAAVIANAHTFIKNLPQGYKTNIGDRGSKLSGGERQRITIARAVYKNPPILILDEATSALDANAERIVQEALNEVTKGRTAIVVAHRLSTVQQADEIIVLREGKIVEQGTHADLLKLDREYAQLAKLQFLA